MNTPFYSIVFYEFTINYSQSAVVQWGLLLQIIELLRVLIKKYRSLQILQVLELIQLLQYFGQFVLHTANVLSSISISMR